MSGPIQNLDGLREAALTLLREVESLASQQEADDRKLALHEEVQRYESELIRQALLRTRGNQRRAAKLLGVKVTTLNCKIKRLGIQSELRAGLNSREALDTDYADLRARI